MMGLASSICGARDAGVGAAVCGLKAGRVQRRERLCWDGLAICQAVEVSSTVIQTAHLCCRCNCSRCRCFTTKLPAGAALSCQPIDRRSSPCPRQLLGSLGHNNRYLPARHRCCPGSCAQAWTEQHHLAQQQLQQPGSSCTGSGQPQTAAALLQVNL